jgi:aquaporin Z
MTALIGPCRSSLGNVPLLYWMAVILAVAYSKGLRGFGGIVFGTMVGLDIFFLAFVSWASMNLASVLGPCLVARRNSEKLWLCWTATFIGTSLIATMFRKKFQEKIALCTY